MNLAHNKAQHLASLAPLAIQSMKELINRISVNQWDDKRYKTLSQACINSADLQEGLLAKKEKRAANFNGQ
jgi:enoyl-CoA hydratase/carnithine racemase